MEIAIPVAVLLVIIVIAVIALAGRAKTQTHDAADLSRSDATLQYVVPEGQDPAAVVAALENHGYLARRDPDYTHTAMVVVDCPEGVEHDRPRVRTVLEQAMPLNMDGDRAPALDPVRFADE
ncbi:MAG: hypothetical protein ACTHNS_10130 [Marmoricola sp.]